MRDGSLHLFKDASEDGYNMSAYVRFFMPVKALDVRLVGKSKSSPVGPISIPRLELQAATLSLKIY